MNYQRPLSKRKKAQLLVVMTIMAWATETMIHQLGYGDEVPSAEVTPSADQLAEQHFVPADADNSVGGTLEVRSDAIITGSAVQLKQVCRWSQGDSAVFTPVGDLVITHIDENQPFHVITLQDLRQTLHDAGVNVALINFCGATGCTVTRSDTHVDEHTALEQWIDSKQPAGASTPATQPASAADVPMQAANVQPREPAASRSLRQVLTENLAQQLNIDTDSLQITFNSQDEKVLQLAEPYFKFDIIPGRMWNLGSCWWDVTINMASETKRVNIRAVTAHGKTKSSWADPWQANRSSRKPILPSGAFWPTPCRPRRSCGWINVSGKPRLWTLNPA